MAIFDSEVPLTDEELTEVRQSAGKVIEYWRIRFRLSAVALLLSCAFVYPFLKGHSLHRYADVFGKYLILLSMALLVVFVLCTGLFWSARQALRDVEREGN
jgi:hypothetical protein